jgi:hypothetical protein
VSEHIAELRAIVAATEPPSAELASYLAKVHERAYSVTDGDVESIKAAGVAEDEIFEQTVAAAIAEGLRRYDAAMEAIG